MGMKDTKEYKEYEEIISRLAADDHVREMKKYTSHGSVSTYEHCENVAKLSYRIDKLLSLHGDLEVLLTGAMLHDFYLYDWHSDGDGSHHLHGFSHAKRASRNAREYLDVDDRVAKVIESHMWPLNLRSVPASREAWVVCIADKCASLYETLARR